MSILLYYKYIIKDCKTPFFVLVVNAGAGTRGQEKLWTRRRGVCYAFIMRVPGI